MSINKRLSKPSIGLSRKTRLAFIGSLLTLALLMVGIAGRNAHASLQGSKRQTPAGTLRDSSGQSQAQSTDKVWQFIDEATINSSGVRQIVPQSYRTVQVNEAALKELLGQAPFEFTAEAKRNPLTFTMPMPDGSFATFHVEESPVMEAPLAAQHPELKTYRGQGIDDPTATTRFDVTPNGFHAIILSAHGTVYIDPYAKGDTANYISYFRDDYHNESQQFACYFNEEDKAPQAVNAPVPNVTNAPTLRTFRLALAADGEYTIFTGGTVATALAAMTTTMNRVNGVYEREVAVHMNMIANENLIIYTDPNTDPYTNNNGSTMLGQNQTNLDTVIGTANYDIGHVFSTGGGGIAGLGVVCTAGNKARGVTGLPSPTGDAFAIDFVAHEMGHQFGGSHTFNGTTSNCGGGNRSGSAAYEVGSGSTIMAYAGICGAQNLQAHSDDYFHVKSLEQIVAFIASRTCDVETATGNTAPTVTGAANVTIPKGTPFSLTASATDPNGDSLTYCWEEYDLGTSSPPDTDATGARPVLRSFNPTSSPSRTFPKLSDILTNTSTFGESLPSISRTMTFQVTVRDNRAGGGGINTATSQVIVDGNSGPFLVTAPNTSVTWAGGSTQTITWDVANTTAAPVSAANVKLSLSTDGGNTFPIVLSASTPNDGTEVITVPNAPTTTARVKVEAVGNVFFDISNANFTITGAAAGTDTIGVYLASNRTFYLRNTNNVGFADVTVQYGPAAATPLIGDWDGNGTSTIGVYDPATRTFYLRNTNTVGNADITIQYGPAGAIPVVGDWDGNGTATIGVYDPTSRTFYLRNSNTPGNADITIQYGPLSVTPVVGDWNGDGTTTIGVYDPVTRTFYLRNSNTPGNADITVAYGPLSVTPVVGDWNGDGTTTIGVYDATSQTFYLRNSNTVGNADITVQYGPAAALPLGGNYDGL